MTAPAHSPASLREQPSQGGPPVGAKCSRKAYLRWAIALGLLVVLICGGLFATFESLWWQQGFGPKELARTGPMTQDDLNKLPPWYFGPRIPIGARNVRILRTGGIDPAIYLSFDAGPDEASAFLARLEFEVSGTGVRQIQDLWPGLGKHAPSWWDVPTKTDAIWHASGLRRTSSSDESPARRGDYALWDKVAGRLYYFSWSM